MSEQNVNLTVNDPINATIQEVAKAVVAVCGVLMSPEGQTTMAQWRTDSGKFNSAIQAVGIWIVNLFRGKIG